MGTFRKISLKQNDVFVGELKMAIIREISRKSLAEKVLFQVPWNLHTPYCSRTIVKKFPVLKENGGWVGQGQRK